MKGPQGMDVLCDDDCYQGELLLPVAVESPKAACAKRSAKQAGEGGRPINNKLQLSSSPQRAAKAPYKASR